MPEQELNVGATITYQVGDRLLTLKPLPLGRMKRAMLAFTDGTKNNLDAVCGYLFGLLDNGSNNGLTVEWIEENVTLPLATEMSDAARVINGLGKLFPKGPTTPEGKKEERPLQEAPPTPSV